MKTSNQDKEKKYNHLAAAEMEEEGNYNMIDGIINNAPKKSVLEKMKEYEQRIAEDNEKSDKNNADTPELSCSSDMEL